MKISLKALTMFFTEIIAGFILLKIVITVFGEPTAWLCYSGIAMLYLIVLQVLKLK